MQRVSSTSAAQRAIEFAVRVLARRDARHELVTTAQFEAIIALLRGGKEGGR